MKQSTWIWTTFFLTAASALLIFFLIATYQAEITTFTIQHPLWAPLIIIVIRTIAMLIPPIPAGLISLSLIPVLGWFWSFIYASIGVTLGACIAFFIARKFREPVVARFMPLRQLHERERQLSNKTEFTTFLIIRLSTGPIMDFVSYVAGLTNISFKKFLIATIIAEIPSMIVYYLYYIGGETYTKFTGQNSGYFGIAFIIILGIFYFVFKDHEIVTGIKKRKAEDK